LPGTPDYTSNMPDGYIVPQRAMGLVVFDTILTTLAFAVVCARIGTRVRLIKNVGAEDYLIIGAMAS